MRQRLIRPGFFNSDELAALPPLTRILFAGLWCAADREGRLKDRPKKIKAEILPYDDHDVDQALTALAAAGFIERYEVGGERFIHVCGFARNQFPHPKEPESVIPEPPADQRKSSDSPPANHRKASGSPVEGREKQCASPSGSSGSSGPSGSSGSAVAAAPEPVASTRQQQQQPDPELLAEVEQLARKAAQLSGRQWQRELREASTVEGRPNAYMRPATIARASPEWLDRTAEHLRDRLTALAAEREEQERRRPLTPEEQRLAREQLNQRLAEIRGGQTPARAP